MSAQVDQGRVEQEAIQILRKELGTPEELPTRVRKVIDACEREEHELQRSMAAIINTQMTDTERAKKLLRESHDEVQTLQTELSAMNEIVIGVDASGAFKHLRQLFIFRKNVASIVEWTRGLKEVQYVKCGEELENGNVNYVFELVKRVNKVREQVMATGKQFRAEQQIFLPYFEKAEVVVSLLVAKILQIFEGAVIATINAAIAEADTPEFVILKDCVEICAAEREKPYVKSPGGDVLLRESVITAAINKGVEKYWDDEILGDVIDITREVPTVLEGMEKLFPLYQALQQTLSPLSTKFPLCALMLRSFNNLVVSTLTRYAEPSAEIESHNLIAAMKFATQYGEFMTEENLLAYVDEEDLGDLGADLLAAAVEGMRSHMAQLAKSCAITVAKEPPQSLPNGRLYTNGPVDLFTIINQSLAAVTSSAEPDVLLKLAGAINAALESYTSEVKNLSDFENWEDKFEGKDTKPEEWKEQRMGMMCAYCNDLDAIETGLDSVESTFAKLLSRSDPLFDDVRTSLPDLALYLVDEIASHLNGVCEVAWKEMFGLDEKAPDKWFNPSGETNPLGTITATLGEYLGQDLTAYLEESWFVKLCRQLLTRTTGAYIHFFVMGIRNAKEKGFSSEQWAGLVRRDADLWHKFWSEVLGASESNVVARAVKLACDAITVFAHILEARDPAQFSMILSREVLDDFGDCPTFVVQSIIDKRTKELDKSTREKMMAAWRERISFQNRDKVTDKPTTGWSQGKSYLGGLDQNAFVVEKQGFFSKKKDPVKEAELEKQRKKEKRKQERAAAEAARQQSGRGGRGQGGGAGGRGGGGGSAGVEVESLDALLGKK